MCAYINTDSLLYWNDTFDDDTLKIEYTSHMLNLEHRKRLVQTKCTVQLWNYDYVAIEANFGLSHASSKGNLPK
jgi:hypothetical protein